jgi:hypothetical protein
LRQPWSTLIAARGADLETAPFDSFETLTRYIDGTAGALMHLAVGAIDASAPAQTLAGHTAAVTRIKVSYDGTRLYSASTDKTARMWNVADGKLLDGQRKWVLRFPAGQLPPVSEFWSITMYNLPQRLLVANPINRYSIGDRTEGLKLGADGSLEIYLQHENPGPDKASNWLPAPAGPFFFVARLYGPSAAALSGQWQLPALQERR